MANHKVPRLSDRTIISVLDEIDRKHCNRALGAVAVSAFDQSLAIKLGPETEDATSREILEADGHSIESFSVQLAPHVILTYWRGGTESQKSPYFDEVRLQVTNADLATIGLAAKVLALFRPHPMPAELDQGALDAVRAVQEATLQRLERVQVDSIERASKHREQLEQAHAVRLATLDAEFEERQRSLNVSIEDQRAALTRDVAALDERAKALDDRGNTHVRRAIRDRMLADVKSRIAEFGVSAATASKRAPVTWGFALLILFFAVAMATASWEIDITAGRGTLTETERWTVLARLALSSFGFVGTLLYYIRWANRWAEQHAASEFALQQFQIDVNRANWVVESCLEWSKEVQSSIPDTLLQSMTRGLFEPPGGPKDPALHPADELASALMGSASKLRLKAGESEIEFDKPKSIPNKA